MTPTRRRRRETCDRCRHRRALRVDRSQRSRPSRRARVLDGHAGELASPTPIIVESSWLIEGRLGHVAEAGFLRGVTSGEITRIDLDDTDWVRCIELIEGYADLGLGLADASVIAVAERLGVTTIATLNHRDFRVVRPAHCDAFDLIP